MRVKTAYHADSENAEWTAQRDPTDPRETKTILKKEKKIPDEPLQDEAAQLQLLLLGLINVILNLTSVSTQDNIFTSWAHSYADFHNTYNFWVCRTMPLSMMDALPWWVSPLHQGDFNHSAVFWDDKQTFLSLVNHNLSLLSWCKTYSQ